MGKTSDFRVDYDQIAHLYDQQPFRNKNVDQHLLDFLREREITTFSEIAILDMACGTGNQLAANSPHVPGARLVGLDLFQGMLRQAMSKSRDILWVRATCECPLFPANSFDFISNHYAFHHVRDKAVMLKAVFRILRPGGRFVMVNVCPREMQDWIYYQYFPEALTIDLQDFLSKEEIVNMLKQEGFRVSMSLGSFMAEWSLAQFHDIISRRDTCSQLMAISDASYQAGLERLEQEARRENDSQQRVSSKGSILTIIADKPA